MTGLSGAEVRRVGNHFVKRDPAVAAEAERLEWLAQQGIKVPRIVDQRDGVLTTEAVPGVPASYDWTDELRPAVVATFVELARALHSLPIEDCPFRRDLDTTMAEARSRVAAGLVDLDNLEDSYAGWTGEQLLAELERTRPSSEDLVVCHGDLTPDNVLVDPRTGRLTGVIDVGRLGVADRWLDLAILQRELTQEPFAAFLAGYGLTGPDQDKLDFYILLDELF
ncbi:aminoglycoside 3'-phosphotransferase [Kribbella capetownensis]|uniref:Aminoglycoside 3'-phosphotransferase n=1 Tax=Kribbella capetownensis TaxID=1572659 RepID=A0A4R0K1T8_9ACTN|nr:APH(3') family aminoglycoside O-phosphotransferase [Kribbella capetownensis]TCC48785.1 aminoglycoside 3'-phosphotransferase [Kribbella capetownensis]